MGQKLAQRAQKSLNKDQVSFKLLMESTFHNSGLQATDGIHNSVLQAADGIHIPQFCPPSYWWNPQFCPPSYWWNPQFVLRATDGIHSFQISTTDLLGINEVMFWAFQPAGRKISSRPARWRLKDSHFFGVSLCPIKTKWLLYWFSHFDDFW